MSASTLSNPSSGPEQTTKPPTRWSEIEDKILKQAVALHGVSHWEDVAKLIWTRKSAEECRARWAELVPILHETLARREYDIEQQKRNRKRSMTTSGSPASASTSYVLPPLPCADLGDKYSYAPTTSKAAGTAKSRTEPSSPESESLLSMFPVPASLPSSPGAAMRTRRYTEPDTRPSEQTARPRRGEPREQVAPHPLMPGRPRKTSASTSIPSEVTTSDNSWVGERGRA
ncbi:hypothetical protein F5Y04DRAFT_287321 [Hypomontagnella monticulosa]|nr:hypothetical protein F5Y04DRAFT_287321 [Hypomontagnella monticulosa]